MGNIIKGIVKRCIPVLIGFVIMILMFFITNISLTEAENTLQMSRDKIAEAENRLAEKDRNVQVAEKKLVRDTTGLDADRVAKDKEIAEDFVSTIFTWDSGEEYDEIRRVMASEYNIPVDSYMMTVLFPENAKFDISDGTVANYIDIHARNCQYESMDVYTAGINAGTYSYFAFVTWSSADGKGNEAMAETILTYDVSAEGVLSNINGYTAAS